MNTNNRKTISKETQEAIKKFLTSNISLHKVSPKTPTIGLDANFSRILQKKREEQLEASRQRLFDSTSKCESTLEATTTEKKSESLNSAPPQKDVAVELENSMMFCKQNRSWNDLSCGEDSFLALERQCNMEDKKERLLNANDTLLFDVEPPSELWNQTVNQSLSMAALNQTQDEDSTVEMSPVKYIGMIRPSTIIEETSSQFESSSKNSSASTSVTTSSLYATASINESFKDCSASIGDISNKSETSKTETKKISPLSQQNSQTTKAERQRRGTFAFKRANYTFFPNENLEPINESASISEADESNESSSISKVETPTASKFESPVLATPKRDLLDFETNSKEDDEDQFNNTLERVDYLLEKGKQILEETPIAKRSIHHQSMLETPLFSCKRKRLLSEMASIEMLPLPKRGPLIDFSTPEVLKGRMSKFNGK